MPAAKKPVAKKPAAKTPVAKKPAAKKPAAKKPAAMKPAAKKPAAKKLKGGAHELSEDDKMDITAKAMTHLGRVYEHTSDLQIKPKRDALKRILKSFFDSHDPATTNDPSESEVSDMVRKAISIGVSV